MHAAQVSPSNTSSNGTKNNKPSSNTVKKSTSKLRLSVTNLVPIGATDYAVVSNTDTDCKSTALVDAVDQHAKILKQRGFTKTNKLCTTLQGEMFEGKHIKTGVDIVIKISDKKLADSRVAIQDNMHVLVEENILKEAVVLHHLTVDNKPISGYIAQFIECFESATSYYLVMRKEGNINLSDFSNKAHQYIKQGKLSLHAWRKIVKFIFWQLSVAINWLHNDIHCVHLDLILENIVVQNGNFILKPDGSVQIDPTLKIKICDFGVAELFNVADDYKQADNDADGIDVDDDDYLADNPFRCSKYGTTDKHYLSAPQVFNEDIYDARKADMWSLGVILYELATGMEPYKVPNKKDSEFSKVRYSKIMELVNLHSKNDYVSSQVVDVIKKLLKVREYERCYIDDILKHKWFSPYYTKYSKSLKKKSHFQNQRNHQLSKKLKKFPYYTYN